jgi:hypothetical protein
MTWLGIFILFSFNKIISEKKCKSFFCVITNWLHFFFFTSNFFCELQLCTQVLIYQKYQKKNAFVIFIVKNFVCCFGNPWLIVLNKLSLFEGENHYFLSPLNFGKGSERQKSERRKSKKEHRKSKKSIKIRTSKV